MKAPPLARSAKRYNNADRALQSRFQPDWGAIPREFYPRRVDELFALPIVSCLLKIHTGDVHPIDTRRRAVGALKTSEWNRQRPTTVGQAVTDSLLSRFHIPDEGI